MNEETFKDIYAQFFPQGGKYNVQLIMKLQYLVPNKHHGDKHLYLYN